VPVARRAVDRLEGEDIEPALEDQEHLLAASVYVRARISAWRDHKHKARRAHVIAHAGFNRRAHTGDRLPGGSTIPSMSSLSSVAPQKAGA
jgi:hypothetical protein